MSANKQVNGNESIVDTDILGKIFNMLLQSQSRKSHKEELQKVNNKYNELLRIKNDKLQSYLDELKKMENKIKLASQEVASLSRQQNTEENEINSKWNNLNESIKVISPDFQDEHPFKQYRSVFKQISIDPDNADVLFDSLLQPYKLKFSEIFGKMMNNRSSDMPPLEVM